MHLMMLDNKDSFTFNIVHMIQSKGINVDVYDNSVNLEKLDTGLYEGLIISPGPGNPLNEADRGNGFELLSDSSFHAVLGICFGHQLIGYYLGCTIYRTDKLFHGEIDIIQNNGTGLLSGLPKEFEAIRYHSLAVRPNDNIIVDAVSQNDGSLMSFHSRDSRLFGIQFHPESHYSQYGDEIISNFLSVIYERRGQDIPQESQ